MQPVELPPQETDGTITVPIRPILVGAFESPRVIANGVEQPYGVGWNFTGLAPNTEESGCEDLLGQETTLNLASGFGESIKRQLEKKIVGMRRLMWFLFVQTRPECASSQDESWIAHFADGRVEPHPFSVSLRPAATFTAADVVRTGEVDLGGSPAELLVRLKGIDQKLVASGAVDDLCEVVGLDQRGFPTRPIGHRRVAGGDGDGSAADAFEEYRFLLMAGAYQVRASFRTRAFLSQDCVVEEGQRKTLDVQISPSAFQSIVLEVLDAHGRERRDCTGSVEFGFGRMFRRMATDPPIEFVVPPGHHFLWVGDVNGCDGSGRFYFDVAAGVLRQKITIRLNEQKDAK